MKKRLELDLLEIMLKEKTITSNSLSTRLGISNKTVRNYLSKSNEILNNYDLKLISKCGHGYCLEGSAYARLKFQNYLDAQKKIPYQSSSSERVCYILYYLLRYSTPLHLSKVESTLYISRSSLYGDLKKATHIAEKYNLTIQNQSNYGITIKGNEKDRRKALFALIQKIHNEDSIFYQNSDMRNFVQECFDNNFTNIKIIKLLQKFDLKNNIRFSKKDFEYLRIMFYITIDRIQHGAHIIFEQKTTEFLNSLSFVRNIPNSQQVFNSLFHINIDSDEICYLSSLFLSLQSTNILIENNTIKTKVKQIINDFVPLIYQKFQIKNREELEKGLYYHLLNILTKTNYDYDYSNPMTQKIKEDYQIAYDIAKKIVPLVNEIANIKFPDDEVAYIAIHIASALEQSMQPIKVLFLYEHRFSELKFSSSLITAHIKEIEIVGMMKYQDYQSSFEIPEYSILFTTFPMSSCTKKFFQIPMLPNKTFINNLREIMRKYFINQNQIEY